MRGEESHEGEAVMSNMTSEYYGDEVLHVEPHGIEPISQSERHGKPRSLFTLWFSANLEFATLTVGVLSVGLFGMSLSQAFWAIAIGTILGAVVVGLLTTFGYRWGVPQLVQSRGAFGFYGNFLPSIINFAAGVGWYAVNTVLGVYALQWLLPIGFLPNLLIMIVLQAAVSIYGHNMIHWIEKVSALILAAVFLIVTFYAFGHINLNIAENVKAPLFSGTVGSFILSIGASLSYIMGWMTYSSDYSRYLPKGTKGSSAFWAAFLGNTIPCIWLELLGAALASVKSIAVPTDLVSGLMPHALVVITMLAIILGTITANVLNIYSGSLSLLAIDTQWLKAIAPKRWIVTLFIGILGGILSYIGGRSGYYTNYSNFLYVLSYWVSPWVAVILMDYLLYRRSDDNVDSFYSKQRALGAGLWSFILGFLASVPFFNQAMYVGFIAAKYPHIGDISYYVSFVVAAILYGLFSTIGRSTAKAGASVA
ncbi:allantoin permease [Ferroacidibacillus organovorans]|uniref:Allantoin permease n=2 Tax=Ferroacidibacillus organovorans TaxID=1765683 RepID=A0A853K9X3_9BACL|nr:allantoin permease [Ferroacidibacillus organovorans]OAG93845.1 allantoin permease [Ferroacidibacillus organovorans]